MSVISLIRWDFIREGRCVYQRLYVPTFLTHLPGANRQPLPSPGPYYVCDGKVNSELCAPIFSADGDMVVGIIDAGPRKEGGGGSNSVAFLRCVLGGVGDDNAMPFGIPICA